MPNLTFSQYVVGKNSLTLYLLYGHVNIFAKAKKIDSLGQLQCTLNLTEWLVNSTGAYKLEHTAISLRPTVYFLSHDS